MFAEVALGLAGVSGMVLILARRTTGHLNSLDKARIAVLFQLTSFTFVLGILPMTLHANSLDDQENFRNASIVMAITMALAMLLARRTYKRARTEYATKITTGRRLLFFGAMSAQLVLSATVGAGLWDAAAMAIYVCGLIVLLGLAFHQLLRFVG